MSRLFLALLCTPLLLPAQAPTPPAANTPPAAPDRVPTFTIPTLTGEQTANIMKQLEQLEQVIGKSRADILGAALTKFKAALAGKDASSLYLDCYKLENFERRDLKATDFLEWKEKQVAPGVTNEDRAKQKDFVDALTLQLEYLVLTIQAQDITEQTDMGPIVTALQAYIPKAIAAIEDTVKHTASGALEEKGNFQGSQNRTGSRANGSGSRQAMAARGGGGGQGSGFAVSGHIGSTLRQSVKASDFAKAYLLEEHLKRTQWSYSPLDIPDIYEKVILPYYLEVKPAEVMTQWDNRINAEMALRKLTMSETEFSLLVKERHPELLWERGNYMLANNINPVQGMADLLKVVRENPTHPRASDWLKTLREMVNKAQPPQTTANPGAATGTPATP